MKAVILAGGFGTRISEESGVRPKPMVEIGGKPILWHIMKIYSANGINDFVVCCGYKGHMIKEYFANYHLLNSDFTIDLQSNEIQVHHQKSEPWRISLVDTGENVMTGGRVKRIKEYVDNQAFCLTYGDGVGNVNIKESIAFHKSQGTIVTMTAVQQPGRFGVFTLGKDQNQVKGFREKPTGGENENAWINGGFFIVEPKAFDYLEGDDTVWEKEPLEKMAENGELSAFKHYGFWQPMDTLRDKQVLEGLWNNNKAPWKIW